MSRHGTIQYLRSLEHFMEQAERQNVEVALSNHTALDNGLERIAYARKRMRYMPNIYLIGQKGFRPIASYSGHGVTTLWSSWMIGKGGTPYA